MFVLIVSESEKENSTGVMQLTFNKRKVIEEIFDEYRQHKYYTLFMTRNINVSITSKIDEVGGGRSNETSDPTAKEAIKDIDIKIKAKKLVKRVEMAVDQLPDIEKQLIKHRYMSRNYDYINDYYVYETKMFISAPHYNKVRNRAFDKLYILLDDII